MNMSGKIASFIMTLSLGSLLACTNTWDDHYDESPLTSAEGIELYTGSTVDYLHAQPELSAICHLFDSAGITNKLSPNNNDLVVCYFDSKASLKKFKEDGYGKKWLENNYGTYTPEDCNLQGVVIFVIKRKR